LVRAFGDSNKRKKEKKRPVTEAPIGLFKTRVEKVGDAHGVGGKRDRLRKKKDGFAQTGQCSNLQSISRMKQGQVKSIRNGGEESGIQKSNQIENPRG